MDNIFPQSVHTLKQGQQSHIVLLSFLLSASCVCCCGPADVWWSNYRKWPRELFIQRVFIVNPRIKQPHIIVHKLYDLTPPADICVRSVLRPNQLKRLKRSLKYDTYISIHEGKLWYNPCVAFESNALDQWCRGNWGISDICLKGICYSFIFILTPNVSVFKLNSRIPLTSLNFTWTQSLRTLTLGLVNYWLITSSDTGHS